MLKTKSVDTVTNDMFHSAASHNFLKCQQLHFSKIHIRGFIADVHIRGFMTAENYNYKSADNNSITIKRLAMSYINRV